MSARVPLLFERQTGDRSLASSINRERLCSLEFSHDKKIHSVATGGIACLDLDHSEQRYLLAGAADASIAVYDTQQPSSEEAAQQQADAREAMHGRHSALDATRPRLRSSMQSAAAAENPGGHAEHAALLSITKASPQAHKYSVSAVAWYPVDSGLFVSGGFDQEVKVWDANTLQVVASFSLGARVYATAMSAVATTHCLVAVGSGDTAVQLCDIVSGGFTHSLSGHRAAVWAIAWSPSSEWQLVTGGCDGQLRLWDIRRSGPLHIFDQHDTQQQRQQRRHQQQQQQADAETSHIDHQQQQRRQQRQLPPDKARKNKSSNAASAWADGDSSNDRAPGSGRMFLPDKQTRYSSAHSGPISGAAATPNGLYWLSAGTDNRVRLWDAATYRHQLVHYPGAYNRASRARQLAVSDDSGVLFHPSGSAIQLYDIVGGQLLRTLGGGHFDTINCCRWNAVTQELYSGGDDCNIVVWAPAPERVTAEREQWQADSDGDAWSD